MVKAILFDMDGTLVDSENVDNVIAIKICRKMGFELTKEEQKERYGRTTKSFYEYLRKKRNAGFDVKETTKNHLADYEKALKKGVESFAGAKETPKMLASNNYKLAVVSGSVKSQIDTVLRQLGIKEFFDVIVSAEDITQSKPNPEGYLLAAKKLNVLPEECVVVEDSAKGIQAGKSANMKVIGVINDSGQDLLLADIVVKNLKEINLETIKSL